jgi:hypothetical protein
VVRGERVSCVRRTRREGVDDLSTARAEALCWRMLSCGSRIHAAVPTTNAATVVGLVFPHLRTTRLSGRPSRGRKRACTRRERDHEGKHRGRQKDRRPDSTEQLRKMAGLHAAGILTDAEFSAKKTELLDRL